MELDFIPVVGRIKGGVQAATGRDLFTGADQSSLLDRGLNLGFAIGPEVAKVAVGAIGKVGGWALGAVRAGAEGADTAVRDSAILAERSGASAADAGADGGHSLSKDLAQACAIGYPNSFQYDTPVEIDNQGDTKAIGTIHIGDHVLAYNEQSGTTGVLFKLIVTPCSPRIRDSPLVEFNNPF
jgi:hypothetical protein